MIPQKRAVSERYLYKTLRWNIRQISCGTKNFSIMCSCGMLW
jgi:hypothetical protein